MRKSQVTGRARLRAWVGVASPRPVRALSLDRAATVGRAGRRLARVDRSRWHGYSGFSGFRNSSGRQVLEQGQTPRGAGLPVRRRVSLRERHKLGEILRRPTEQRSPGFHMQRGA